MDKTELLTLTAKVRRGTSNQDIVTVCNEAERMAHVIEAATKHMAKVEAHRVYMRGFMKRHRAKLKAAKLAGGSHEV